MHGGMTTIICTLGVAVGFALGCAFMFVRGTMNL